MLVKFILQRFIVRLIVGRLPRRNLSLCMVWRMQPRTRIPSSNRCPLANRTLVGILALQSPVPNTIVFHLSLFGRMATGVLPRPSTVPRSCR